MESKKRGRPSKIKLVTIRNIKTGETKNIHYVIPARDTDTLNSLVDCPECGRKFIQSSAIYDTDWYTPDKLHHIGRCPKCYANSHNLKYSIEDRKHIKGSWHQEYDYE